MPGGSLRNEPSSKREDLPDLQGSDEIQWIVIYDADCGFCRWSLGRLIAWDRHGRLRPLALGMPEADKLLYDLSPEQREDSWHLVSPDRRRESAGAAAPALLRLLPGGRLPASLLAAFPRTTERAYRWVADHRSTLSKLIPEGAKRRADERVAQAAASAGS
jgi:predicted DCC family thiol-disulfide oxidoreductase YuxK